MQFSEWLVNELTKRGWSRSEAARRGGFSPSMFDKVINGHSRPGIKFAQGVAHAFNIPLADVLAAINGRSISPISEEASRRAGQIVKDFKYPETRERALEYLEFLRLQEERGQYTTPTPESLKKALGS